MPPASETINAKRQALAKTPAPEIWTSHLLHEAFSFENFDERSRRSDSVELLIAAVKRIASLINNGSPEDQQAAVEFLKATLNDSTIESIARAVVEGLSSRIDKNTATKAQDLLQVLSSLCNALNSIQRHDLAQVVAVAMVEQVINSGATSQLRSAGAKPAIMVLWFMQSSVVADYLPKTLIDDVLEGIDVHGESPYRSRLISALLSNPAYISQLGYENSEEAVGSLLKEWYLPGRLPRSDLAAIATHLLPLLLEKRPALAKSVLQALATQNSEKNVKYAYIPAWTAVARVGVITSGLKLADLDPASLDCAIHHGDEEIRLGAWFILSQCQSSTDQIEDIALGRDGLLSRSLADNMAVPSLEFRNDFVASFGKFVERLYTSANAAVKQSQKPLALSKQGDPPAQAAHDQQKVACTEYASQVVQFVEHLLEHFVDRSIFLPMSTYHARIITGLSMLSNLEEHLGGRNVSKKTGRNQVTWPILFTERRVECLIACLGSNFADVRQHSADLLQNAPSPPKFQDPSYRETLLESALDRLNGARNTDAEAGGLVIQILYHSLRSNAKESNQTTQSSQAQLFQSILERLEKRLVRMDTSSTLAEEPLHGLLLALIRIVSSWDSSIISIDYSVVVKRILHSVGQIWDVCRPIISTQEGDNHKHEISGAYDVLDGNEDEGEGEGEGNDGDDVHLTILSNCWRAIKEASDLVAVLCERVPASHVSPELAASSGDLYMRWLRHIRHRGTFSSMVVAFEKFLDVPAVPHGLRKSWLEQQLQFIASGDAATTRRSGALPYAVLALVHRDGELFDMAFSQLASIVKNSPNDAARIHAMHSIRVMLLDARHSHFFKGHFEQSIMLALDAYHTENWSVRNAALLLSANITIRAIGKPLNDLRYRSARRPTLPEWVQLYPQTISYFGTVLEESRDVDAMEPAAFIVLLIFRSLDTADSAMVPGSLTNKLMPLLAKREIKARQVTAQALANLSSVDDICILAEDLCAGLEAGHLRDLNAVHGRVLVLEAFVLKSHLAREEPVALKPFQNRFLEAFKSARWPAVITAGLSDVVAAIENSPATLCRKTSADSVGENSSAAENLQLSLGNSPVQAEIIRALSTPNSDTDSLQSDSWERLYQTYVSTTNEPLKNELLPVLGHFGATASFSSATDLLKLIEDAAQDHRSEESRKAAVASLRELAPQLGRSMTRHHFNVADLLLQDDNAEVRTLAAECIGIAFQTGYPLSQEKAEAILWERATTRFNTSSDFGLQLLEMLTRVEDVEQMRHGLDSGSGDLFAEEPANIYIEPYHRRQRLSDAFCALDHKTRTLAIQASLNRIHDCRALAENSTNGLEEKISPLDKRREPLILLEQTLRILHDVEN